MKTVLKHIMAISVSVILVFSAGGIDLFSHYCSCTGFESQSVFVPVKCDDHHNSGQCLIDHQAAQIKGCCVDHPAENPIEGNVCDAPEGCCRDEVIVLKTDIFDNSKSPRVFIKDLPTIQIIFHQIVAPELKLVAKNNSPGYPDDLPPPLYGKELLFSIRQLKFDIPLA